MTVDQLPPTLRAFYDSFTHKPQIDIVSGQVLFTWHFVPEPLFSAMQLHLLYNPRATAWSIQHADNPKLTNGTLVSSALQPAASPLRSS